MFIVKKYRNRRLYDSEESRYVTLDEVTAKVKAGKDVKVVDASSGDDITQELLVQVLFAGREGSKLLPTPLLLELVRLSDDALAEFCGQYMTWAFQVYSRMRRTARYMTPWGWAEAIPNAAQFARRMFGGGAPSWPGYGPPDPAWNQGPWGMGAGPDEPMPGPPVPAPPAPSEAPAEPDARSEIAALRAEMERLRDEFRDAAGAADSDRDG